MKKELKHEQAMKEVVATITEALKAIYELNAITGVKSTRAVVIGNLTILSYEILKNNTELENE